MCIRDSGFAANLGFGFLYPVAYCEAVTKMKEGNLGEQGKEFFEAFPDGAISCEYIVVQCNECGKLMNVPKLDLYVPKDGYDASKQNKNTRWSVAFSGNGYDLSLIHISKFELPLAKAIDNVIDTSAFCDALRTMFKIEKRSAAISR